MRHRDFDFTVKDFAKLFGISQDATRKLIRRKRFDPSSLRSIIDYYQSRKRLSE